jgi:uncharacterized protein (DUF697 family)
MAKESKAEWLTRNFGVAAQAGFRRAYQRIRVDEQKYLRQVTRAYKLPIKSWSEMFLLGPEVIDPIAKRTIASSAKMAALEGTGLGLGGFLTVVPDMGVLSAITVRMLQKLSLLYGFEYAGEQETVGLWLAAASAAGLDLGRDFVEKQAIERLVPRIVDRVAVRVGAEVAEKWAARIVPVLSAAAGGAINYYFVRGWGRRAQKHFLARHRSVVDRGPRAKYIASQPAILLPSSSTL